MGKLTSNADDSPESTSSEPITTFIDPPRQCLLVYEVIKTVEEQSAYECTHRKQRGLSLFASIRTYAAVTTTFLPINVPPQKWPPPSCIETAYG